MDKQEVFDTVCRHLAVQKTRSVFDETVEGTPTDSGPVQKAIRCAYRGTGSSEGLKCALGCLIPDEEYEAWMEGAGDAMNLLLYMTIYGERAKRAPKILEILSKHANLCAKLQLVHDCSETPEEVRVGLNEVARDFNLDPTNADLVTEWK